MEHRPAAKCEMFGEGVVREDRRYCAVVVDCKGSKAGSGWQLQ